MTKFSLVLTLLFTINVWADGDFAKHEASLYQLTGKINANESAIKTLLKEQNETTDIAKSHEITEEIKKNLKERKENIIKYNKEYNHILYEHPGKMDYPVEKKEPEKGGHEKPHGHSEGAHEEKSKIRYKRYDEKSIKEFEDETNKLLSNVYQNIKKKYNEN